MSRFLLCNCPAGFDAAPERHAPDCPGRSGAGKSRAPGGMTHERFQELMGNRPTARGVAQSVLDMTAAVDAAMVEMAGIHPPLRRSDCERLIRAALNNPKPRTECGQQPAKYPQLRRVRQHTHTCACVVATGPGYSVCNCGAVVDGVAVEVKS